MKNGCESLIRKWKLRSIQKVERNSRNITKIDNWTLKKKWFVRLRDELTVKKQMFYKYKNSFTVSTIEIRSQQKKGPNMRN